MSVAAPAEVVTGPEPPPQWSTFKLLAARKKAERTRCAHVYPFHTKMIANIQLQRSGRSNRLLSKNENGLNILTSSFMLITKQSLLDTSAKLTTPEAHL